jgi:hypothetical protein
MNAKNIALFFLIFFAANTYADWAEIGAAVRCDGTRGIFSLISTVETSDGESSIPEAYAQLPAKERQNIKCNLGSAVVDMAINIYGPQPRGAGQEAGVIIINHLNIGPHKVFEYPANFNWQASPNERVLTEIHIQKKGRSHEVQLCFSDDGTLIKENYKCEKSIINIDG